MWNFRAYSLKPEVIHTVHFLDNILFNQQMHVLSRKYTVTYQLPQNVSASLCHHQGDIRQIIFKTTLFEFQ
jgi:hypothetical protein